MFLLSMADNWGWALCRSKMDVWGNSRALILSIILIFIAVAVTPSAIPVLEKDVVSANTSPPSSDPLSSSSSSLSYITTTIPPTNPPRLHPRTPILHHISPGTHVTLAHGWIVTVRALASFLPAPTVAAALESFFQQALVQLAHGLLRNRPPPGRALDLSVGSVNLALRAINPGDYLTWEVCEVVVAQLLEDARRGGLTGQFQAEWYHPASGTLLYVSLGVLRRVRAGPVG